MSLACLLARVNGGASVLAIEHDAFTRVVADKSRSIVDVREPHGYAAGHIPGAINLPLSSFTPRQLPSGRPVVLVCLAGGRSVKALQQAVAAGHKDICHYAPGTGGWKNRGGPLAA
jgi:rhodanese-related sulfurtransferase